MIRSIAPAALLLLSACAKDAAVYPSLAPRAVEKQGFTEPVVTPLQATPDPALDAAIAKQRAALATLRSGFDRDAASAERAAAKARGNAAGSDAWLDAQTALATLDGWHAQASGVVTEVDTLGADRAAALLPDYPALTALRANAQAEVDRQGEMIARLQATLSSG